MPKRNFKTKALLVAGEDADRVAGWNFDILAPADLEGSNDLTKTGHAMLTTGIHGRSSRVFGAASYAGTGPGDATTTVSAWVKPAGAVTNQAIWDFSNASNQRRSLSFDGTGKAVIAYGAGAQRTSVAAPALRAEHWHHLAAVHRLSGWDELTPANTLGDRFGHAMVYDQARQEIMSFSGSHVEDIVLNDTQVFSGGNWTERSPTRSPPGRVWPGMVYDVAREEIVMFGGFADGDVPFAEGFRNDTWVWDGTNWTERNPTTSPPGREFSMMAYDSENARAVLFGGRNDTQVLNDTWIWDGTNWSQVTTATTPAARMHATFVFDPVRDVVVMFGGTDLVFNSRNDTWEFDGTDWTEIFPTASPPIRRSAHGWFDRKRIVIHAGSDEVAADFNDTWEYDGTTWTEITDVGPPPVRWNHGSAYDTDRRVAVVYGGTRFESGPPREEPRGDMWEYTSPGTRFFIDGEEQTMAVEASAGAAASANDLIIGDLLAGSAEFTGEINSLEILSRELTEAEVDARYQKGATVVAFSDDLSDSQTPGEPATGAQLLVDGDMEAAGVGDWIAGSAILTKETGARPGSSGSQIIRVTADGETVGQARQVILTIGKQYRVNGWARSGGTNLPRVWNNGFLWTGTTSTDWQYFDFVFVSGHTNLSLYSSTSDGNSTEFDDVEIREIFNVATAGPIAKTVWKIGSGEWSTDPTLFCAATGFCSTVQQLAFGTWEFSVIQPSAESWEVAFIAGARAAVADASQNGYSLFLSTTGVLTLRRRTAGAATALFSTASGFLAPGVLHQFRTTRDRTGVLTVFVKGGAFTDWTLVAPTTGSNPVTDTNHLSGEYWVNDCNEGVGISAFKIQHGVVT